MVPTPTAADFKIQFPEFRAEQDDAVTAMLDLAASVNAQSTNLISYLTAHLLTVASADGKMDGGSGEVTMDGIGPRQVSYRTMAETGDEVFFTRSSYGRMYLMLAKRNPNRTISVKVFG